MNTITTAAKPQPAASRSHIGHVSTKYLLLAGLLVFTGCATEIQWKRGMSIKPITPPEDAIVRVEVTQTGIVIGQNQVSQSPEIILGQKRLVYTRVQTGTNPVYAAAVKATHGVSAGLSAGIEESLETGDAVK